MEGNRNAREICSVALASARRAAATLTSGLFVRACSTSCASMGSPKLCHHNSSARPASAVCVRHSTGEDTAAPTGRGSSAGAQPDKKHAIAVTGTTYCFTAIILPHEPWQRPTCLAQAGEQVFAHCRELCAPRYVGVL